MGKFSIVFDFDGVINSYTSGWVSPTDLPDLPVEGIRETIAEIMTKYKVVVVSTRCCYEGGIEAISKWLEKYDIVDSVSAEKPPAIVYIDDRAVRFDGNTHTQTGVLLSIIDNFKPWNYRSKL